MSDRRRRCRVADPHLARHQKVRLRVHGGPASREGFGEVTRVHRWTGGEIQRRSVERDGNDDHAGAGKLRQLVDRRAPGLEIRDHLCRDIGGKGADTAAPLRRGFLRRRRSAAQRSAPWRRRARRNTRSPAPPGDPARRAVSSIAYVARLGRAPGARVGSGRRIAQQVLDLSGISGRREGHCTGTPLPSGAISEMCIGRPPAVPLRQKGSPGHAKRPRQATARSAGSLARADAADAYSRARCRRDACCGVGLGLAGRGTDRGRRDGRIVAWIALLAGLPPPSRRGSRWGRDRD
jgi:hypothetical protein